MGIISYIQNSQRNGGWRQVLRSNGRKGGQASYPPSADQNKNGFCGKKKLRDKIIPELEIFFQKVITKYARLLTA